MDQLTNLEVDPELDAVLEKTKSILNISRWNDILKLLERRIAMNCACYETYATKRKEPKSNEPVGKKMCFSNGTYTINGDDYKYKDEKPRRNYARAPIEPTPVDPYLTAETIEAMIVKGATEFTYDWVNADAYNLQRAGKIVLRTVTGWLQEHPTWAEGEFFEIM